jgi:hypothetical protein
MPPLTAPHEEALARALAMGRSRNAAGTETGHGRRYKHRARAARPEIIARAREIGDALQWGEACEVGEMIRALMRLAGKAGGMRTAAAMVAARGLVAEAAKLDARRETPGEPAPIASHFLPLSDEAWAAKYGNRG